MKEINHLKVIKHAFWDTSKNKEMLEKDWYVKRLSHCEACEYNTIRYKPESLQDEVAVAEFTAKNMEYLKYELSKGAHDVLAKILGVEPEFCALCGCFIKQKCAARGVVCSLIKQGTPKWNKLEVNTAEGHGDFDLINLDDALYNVYLRKDGKAFVIDLGSVKADADPISFKFLLRTKVPLNFDSATAQCNCLTTSSRRANATTDYEITATFNPKEVSTGEFSKEIIVSYRTGKKRDESKLVIININGKIL
jgi:hypothetical protein